MRSLQMSCLMLLLLCASAFGQETKVGVEYTAVLSDSFLAKNPHKEVGKCTNCHMNAMLNVDASGPAIALLWNGESEESSVPLTLTEPDKTTRSILQLPKQSGLIVGGICPSEKGKLFGLQKHDIILKINQQPVDQPTTVKQAIATDHALTFTILRDGKERQLKRKQQRSAKTGAKAKGEPRYLLGVSLGELDPVVKAQLKLEEKVSVYIKQVAKDGAAAEAGLKENDILISINEQPVGDANALSKLIQKSGGKHLSIRFYRDRETQEMKITPRSTDPVSGQYFWYPGEAKAQYKRIWSGPDFHGLQALPDPNQHQVWASSARNGGDLKERLNKIESKLDQLLKLLSEEK